MDYVNSWNCFQNSSWDLAQKRPSCIELLGVGVKALAARATPWGLVWKLWEDPR